MVHYRQTPAVERAAMLAWMARFGAVTAEALAEHRGTTVASARASLLAAQRDRLLTRRRPLSGQPALYTLTRAGLRASGVQGLEPCRVSAAGARHMIVCAAVAAALERCYPDHHVIGERELRRDERQRGVQLASADLGGGPSGAQPLHRPDLVLWPREGTEGYAQLPVAVEVELTLKAPRRLAQICRAWARCRCVAGVLYLAAPEVEGALQRAVASVDGAERIVVVALGALPTENAAGGA